MQIEKSSTQSLSWADVDRLCQAETAGPERREIVRRLIAGAARRPAAAGASSHTGYEDALRRALERARQARTRLTEERRDAGRLWHLLAGHPPSRRGMLVRNDRRLQTWGLYELLRERALAEREPTAALQAAILALAAAQSLPADHYGAERVRDFEGAALVQLAEARRNAGDLAGAAATLDQARPALAQGTGDPMELAELEKTRAAVLQGLGRTGESLEAGRRALRLAGRVGGPRKSAPRPSLDETHPALRRKRA